MALEIADFVGIFSSGLGNIFGTGAILGIFGLIIFFIIAYKFNFPPIMIFMVITSAAYLIGGLIIGDWVKALGIIAIAAAIGLIGYRVISSGG